MFALCCSNIHEIGVASQQDARLGCTFSKQILVADECDKLHTLFVHKHKLRSATDACYTHGKSIEHAVSGTTPRRGREGGAGKHENRCLMRGHLPLPILHLRQQH